MNHNIRRAQWLQRLFPGAFYKFDIWDDGISAQGNYNLELATRLVSMKFKSIPLQYNGFIRYTRGNYRIVLT